MIAKLPIDLAGAEFSNAKIVAIVKAAINWVLGALPRSPVSLSASEESPQLGRAGSH